MIFDGKHLPEKVLFLNLVCDHNLWTHYLENVMMSCAPDSDEFDKIYW